MTNGDRQAPDFDLLHHKFQHFMMLKGACQGFLKGGGPISLGSLKKGRQILKGGVQWSDGGSSTLVSLGRQILHI